MNANPPQTDIREIKGLIADRWPTFWAKLLTETPRGQTPAWELQYEDLAARCGSGETFDGLYRALRRWDRADRPPLAREVEDLMGNEAPKALAKHLHLPWREEAEKPLVRGTDAERERFISDWKQAAYGSPADALARYSKAVAGGDARSMREYFKR